MLHGSLCYSLTGNTFHAVTPLISLAVCLLHTAKNRLISIDQHQENGHRSLFVGAGLGVVSDEERVAFLNSHNTVVFVSFKKKIYIQMINS